MLKLPNLHRYASAQHFDRLAGKLTPWLLVASLLLIGSGLYQALWIAPPDYQQGDSVRIMYIHVPSAWMSLFIYIVMAGAGLIALVWRIKVAELIATASAPLGASFTALTLITGSLWGKPMWGTWWVWDARLTSELILLFLYLGHMGLEASLPDRRQAARAAAILALVGLVNIPIIHFSVEWWNTLHQGPSVSRLDSPAIDTSMLIPLLLMAVGFKTYFFAALLMRTRCLLLDRESQRHWVQTLAKEAL